ncbi:MAG TPA: HAD-IIB family hydrolase [Candidatus Paceibacterota bacterium]
MKKYIFFDLDNTLTRSRSLATPTVIKLLKTLAKNHEVLVVSGQSAARIAAQLGPTLDGTYWSMGQNGNRCVDKSGNLLWEHNMNWLQKFEVLSYSHKILSKNLFPYKDKLDLVDDRGSQISYSFVGHTEKIGLKEKFDPDKTRRTMVLKKFPFKSKTVEVKIAGTTCFDFFIKGSHKGKNISDLCKKMGWKKNNCLYIGDALFKNGNDEAVIGVIPIKKVRDPNDTERVIQELLLKK